MNKPFQQKLAKHNFTWLITGAAGFIGSHLAETLLKHNQKVIGLDNFSTGHKKNLKQLLAGVPKAQQKNFKFIEGDIRRTKDCKKATKGVDFVLHQAALGSVPRSILDPSASFESNALGFVNILFAAKEAKVKQFVYASSSAVYGDHPVLPKKEEHIGKPLSPYALTKHVNELTAEIFHRNYGIDCVGLRYFNVFGARQDSNGAYAAVIPLWIKSLIKNEKIFINGDGETSRDFCYVDNVVQANILAALCTDKNSLNRVYNVSCGKQTTLNELYDILKKNLLPDFPKLKNHQATCRDFREGDIRHSLADISAAQKNLGYQPTKQVAEGIALSIEWYKNNL